MTIHRWSRSVQGVCLNNTLPLLDTWRIGWFYWSVNSTHNSKHRSNSIYGAELTTFYKQIVYTPSNLFSKFLQYGDRPTYIQRRHPILTLIVTHWKTILQLFGFSVSKYRLQVFLCIDYIYSLLFGHLGMYVYNTQRQNINFINTIYLYLGDVEIHTLNIYVNVYICVVCTYVLLFRWNEYFM